jgi:hypothetical protein
MPGHLLKAVNSIGSGPIRRRLGLTCIKISVTWWEKMMMPLPTLANMAYTATPKSGFGYEHRLINTLLLNNDQHSLLQYSTYHHITIYTYTTITIMPWENTYKIPQTHTYLMGIFHTVITILQNIYTITAMADIHQIIHFTTNHAKTNILQY